MSTIGSNQIKQLGIDAGGTFTDFVLIIEDGSIRTHKVLSTPDNPAEAILRGIQELGLNEAAAAGSLRVTHGSTVATNAVLEGKVARTAYVTNKGFKDVLTIGRQNRPELYNLMPVKRPPPVPEKYCLEVDCRRAADGAVIKALDDADVETLKKHLSELRIEAVAINLLFSFLDDEEERRLEKALKDQFVVSRSSYVLPVYKEYERGIATWLNASLRPKVQSYLETLNARLPGCDISIMQSSGGLLSLDEAAKKPVNLLLSGPAGGLSAVKLLSKETGFAKILSFDMGGTSTDVSLLDGDFQLTNESRIANWPVAIPMLQMDTIGAGGGSIAWVDDAGMLHVGPESAGSKPGPACYNLAGTAATVTDANLVLGHLPRDAKLGGSLSLDLSAAEESIRHLANKLGLSVLETAQGIVQVAEQQMVGALHNVSVQQGQSPKDFVLCCFGGAGGMHVCSLAEQLEMREAIIPRNAGVLSAYGMLTAAPQRSLTHSHIQVYDSSDASQLEALFSNLQDELRLDSPELLLNGTVSRHLDLRYLGQSYTIEVEFNEISAKRFEEKHKQLYGHTLNKPLELVNLKLSVTGSASITSMPSLESHQSDKVSANEQQEVLKVYRDQLPSGFELKGPAVIYEQTSTTWLKPGWLCRVDSFGNLLLSRQTG